ncbi:LysR family transcriptional regulator [Cellulomonas chitinilytica]|uniref:LysR family transcriptional regulator n=1 Tax=Cellulomonas chitinilytica TaxID=398759 RepID=A0A919P6Z8_9CELL|nr:LysR family substrate-binding domain-containing protein [Cellulomonas chitinilytica]GIG23282.1 LysR family transcriptional regulator [Cellulomonas chitinilytica]
MSEQGTTSTGDDAERGGREFRVLIVPGVNPDRWLRVWQERLADVPVRLLHADPADAVTTLRDGGTDVALVRLPVDRDGLHVIPLYTEATVVMVPKDHVFSVAEEVTPEDLADETVIRPDDDLVGWSDAPGTPFTGGAVPTTADAVDLVAAGVGVLLLPQSVARLHQRRGLTARPVVDSPGSAIGLAWLVDADDELTEEFIGIVRGRTAGSSRGRGAPPASPKKPTADAKKSASSQRGGSTRGQGPSSGTAKRTSGRGASPKRGARKPRGGR